MPDGTERGRLGEKALDRYRCGASKAKPEGGGVATELVLSPRQKFPVSAAVGKVE